MTRHDAGTRTRPPPDDVVRSRPLRRRRVAVRLLMIAVVLVSTGCAQSATRPETAAAGTGTPDPNGSTAPADPIADVRTGDPGSPAAPPAGPVVGVQTHVLWADQDDAERLETLDLVADTHVGWVRMDLGWCSIEERQGELSEWKLDRADRMVDAARDRGLQVLVTLWCTPEWASDKGTINAPPRDPSDYANIAGILARHFRGRVAAWEVWNEPNGSEFWEGADPSSYVGLLRAAYPAFKAGDPAATVVFGGVSYNDTAWIDRAYAAGAAGAFDVLGVHPYMGIADQPPETPYDGNFRTFRGVEAVRAVMLEHSDDRPIWFTEFGWSVNDNGDDAAAWTRGVTPDQQATYLVEAIELVEAEYPYVTHMFWYNDRATAIGDDRLSGFGLLTRDLEPRPAYDALQRYLARR